MRRILFPELKRRSDVLYDNILNLPLMDGATSIAYADKLISKSV